MKKTFRLLRNPVAWVAVVIFGGVGVFAYAEFSDRPSLDPNAEDNQLPEM
jgi:hypothetical protein